MAKCTKAIEAQPDSVEAFQLRASAYENAAYYSAAIGDYTSLIRLTKGAAKFHFYRAELYSKRIENQKAIDDYTTVITKEPTGPFTAKAFYGRALIYDKVGRKPAAQADYWSAVKLDPGFAEAKKKIEYPFGDMTITQATDNIIPGIPPTLGMTDKVAETKPKPLPTPTPDILKGGTITDATDRILTDTLGGGKGKYDGLFDGKTNSSAAAVKVPAEWKRTVLTGTGLSVASPAPFILQRSEPLASLVGNVEAEVSWKFEQGGLRAYVGYTKEDKGYKAVRQHLEDNIQYLLNNAKAVESLIHDTKFLGETGAFYDEVEFDGSSNRSMRRKVLVFGGPIAYRRILHIFPADDTAAAPLSSQIIASFKNEGSLAVGKPRFPPLEWKLYNFGNVLFEFPAKPSEGNCKSELPERVSQTCAVWGDNLVNLHVMYSTYPPRIPQPTAMQAAEEHVRVSKELESRNKDNTRSDFRISSIPINFGDAALVVENSGFSKTKPYLFVGTTLYGKSAFHTLRFSIRQSSLASEPCGRSNLRIRRFTLNNYKMARTLAKVE
ncbi:MAG: hypothetical protein IPK98_14360 [Chloracidobacterium sp.]|nr:hypothetical protein [Chloracidobacterium sp.]